MAMVSCKREDLFVVGGVIVMPCRYHTENKDKFKTRKFQNKHIQRTVVFLTVEISISPLWQVKVVETIKNVMSGTLLSKRMLWTTLPCMHTTHWHPRIIRIPRLHQREFRHVHIRIHCKDWIRKRRRTSRFQIQVKEPQPSYNKPIDGTEHWYKWKTTTSALQPLLLLPPGN